MNLRCLLLNSYYRALGNREAEPRGKAHRAKHTQLVLSEA